MMTDREYDRLERMVRLFYDDSLRASRESRKQTAELRKYARVLRDSEVARQALAANPNDVKASDNLNRALAVLDQAREALKH